MSLFWILAATIMAAPVILLILQIARQRRSRASQTAKTAWLVAATTSGTMLMFIGATINELVPIATAIDIAALGATGIVTGFSLALGLAPGD